MIKEMGGSRVQLRASVVVLGISVAVAATTGVSAPAGAQQAAPAVTATGYAQPVDPTVTSLPITGGFSARATGGARRATVTSPVGARSFSTVGVTWRRGGTSSAAGLTVEVRTHGAKGWGAWRPLDLDESSLADRTSTDATLRDGTGSLYAGPSDGAEARVTASKGALPQDLQFDLIDPGSSTHDSAPQPGVSAQAVQGAPRPAVLSRAEWGANEKLVRSAPTYMSTVKAAVLHHTAGPNGYSKAEVPSILRGDYAYHVKSRGWSDIGYNALVDRFGRVWEGRAGGLDRNVMGAHAGGFNTATFGVAVIGSYQYARPSAAVTASVAKLFAWKLALNHRNPSGTASLTSSGGGTARYRAGATVQLPAIMGHRNTGYTECPGGNLYAKLGAIRKQALDATVAGLINPIGAPASVTLGEPMSITATALRTQSWTLTVTGPCEAGTVRTITGSAAAGRKITATWDGRLADGKVAPAGRYRLALTSSSSRGAAEPVTDDVLVVPAALPDETAAAPLGGSGGYVPLAPARIHDSRVGPGSRAQVAVLGRGGVPTGGVTGVVLNVIAQCVSDTTSLTVWPTGGAPSPLPLTGAVPGATRSVLVSTAVGANGQVSLGNLTGVTRLTVDVVGYYGAAGGPVRAIPSTRLLDTAADPITDATRTVTLPATLDGVASSAVRAVLVDVGGVAPGKQGTLTAHATGTAPSLRGTSFAGATIADNLAIVPVTGGQFQVTATGGPVRAILDARGLVLAPGNAAGSAMTAVTPRRVLNGVAVVPGTPRRVVVTGGAVPATAKAVLVQLSGAGPAVGATLQAHAWNAYPTGGTAVRVPKGLTRGNLALVPVGAEGAIAVSASSTSVRSSVDVYGYLR